MVFLSECENGNVITNENGKTIYKVKIINNQIRNEHTNHPKLRHAAKVQTHGIVIMDLEHKCAQKTMDLEHGRGQNLKKSFTAPLVMPISRAFPV